MTTEIHARICELTTKSLSMNINPPKTITLDYLLSKVSAEFEISEATIKGRSRKEKVVLARHIFAFIARVKFGFSLPVIGKFINRDHTSILYFEKTGKDRIWTKDEVWLSWYNKALVVIARELN